MRVQLIVSITITDLESMQRAIEAKQIMEAQGWEVSELDITVTKAGQPRKNKPGAGTPPRKGPESQSDMVLRLVGAGNGTRADVCKQVAKLTKGKAASVSVAFTNLINQGKLKRTDGGNYVVTT